MSIELKVKVKSLAEEARIIRKEERKLHGLERARLHDHRVVVVRDAARRTLVAYQYVRGRDWESCASQDPYTRKRDWPVIAKMIKKYGSYGLANSWEKLAA
ncbi:MAG: hypothetical protein AMJ72_05365 [Acidithiobacillales bacterium SM1_46]|nr:MAG: hypothetical protein AMJ72_05365 [Acidithiobacillales bacterium SM1_46]